MQIYPNGYTPAVAFSVDDLKKSEITWAFNRLKAYMTDKTRSYSVNELIHYLEDEVIKQTNRHYPTEVYKQLVMDLDAEWGWHPSVETSKEIK